MQHFSSVPLSSAKRPILLNGEVELKSENCVSVVLQINKVVQSQLLSSGLLILTNYRLISVQFNALDKVKSYVGWGINLDKVLFVEDCSKFFSRSTRVRLCFGEDTHEIGLKFEQDGKEDMILMLKTAMERKSWLSIAPSVSLPVSSVFCSSAAGVGGLIRRQEKSLQSVENVTRTALADLDTLINRAKESISIIQRFASCHTGSSVERLAEGGELEALEVNEMETVMQSIGMVSPVTKFSAGRLYHEQLARQTVDILLSQRRLERLGGMITLSDLYCLLNRARGTVLVSPEDLLESTELIERLSLGMRLRRFHSGVMILQLDSKNSWLVRL